LGKLEEGLSSSWEGIIDAELAQKRATLEWIDGRLHNIAEDGLDDVRK
jgi:hypothetical protein